MTERSTGFRFDIYERVRVPDDLPGIGDLEQVELIPRVSGIPGQEHSVLKGHLHLSAVYMPDGEAAEKQSFEHNIPVEISLPVRGEAAEGDIQVRIDQFDVELISQRSLNVTGVLSLSGWNFSSDAPPADERNEEIVAVHHAGKPNSQPVQVVAGEHASPAPHEEEFAEELNDDENDVAEEQVTPAADDEIWGPLKDDFEELHANESNKRDEGSSPAEPKVAFKPHLQSETDAIEKAEAVASGSINNSLEWRKLFLHGHEEPRFQKLRICIVRKEDTIQTIAERYKLQPREISLYNRLGESDVSEGQVLYIPSR